jgi:uncharacterized phosphosugar-binding protein
MGDEEQDTMSAEKYFSQINEVLKQIEQTQRPAIEKAAAAMAKSIRSDGLVYLFGSGHSVIPVLDIFPRYGSFVGFCPIYDPRLMWFNVVGPGGARELLWLEREEGYAKNVLASYSLEPRDTIMVFSHGGLNAAPVEVATQAKARGLTVVTVSSHQNYRQSKATHSSGKQLSDLADVAIDNCVPPEDALVGVEGIKERFAAGSTVAVVTIAMALVAEVGSQLVKSGHKPPTFVSPNVGLEPDHNQQVFVQFARRISRRVP